MKAVPVSSCEMLQKSGRVTPLTSNILRALLYPTCMTSVRTQVNRDCPRTGVLARILRHMVREDNIIIFVILDVRRRIGLQLLTTMLTESVATRNLAHGRVEAWRYGLPHRKHQLVTASHPGAIRSGLLL